MAGIPFNVALLPVFTSGANYYIYYIGGIPCFGDDVTSNEIRTSLFDSADWWIIIDNTGSESTYSGTFTATQIIATDLVSGTATSDFTLASSSDIKFFVLHGVQGDTGAIKVSNPDALYIEVGINDPQDDYEVTDTSDYYIVNVYDSTALNATWFFNVYENEAAATNVAFTVTDQPAVYLCDPAIDCSGQGTCDVGGRTCTCDPTFNGPSCECNPEITCSGHGTCQSDASCECDDGFEGSNCGNEVDDESAAFGLIPSALLSALAFYCAF
jgi:hypothetical protein